MASPFWQRHHPPWRFRSPKLGRSGHGGPAGGIFCGTVLKTGEAPSFGAPPPLAPLRVCRGRSWPSSLPDALAPVADVDVEFVEAPETASADLEPPRDQAGVGPPEPGPPRHVVNRRGALGVGESPGRGFWFVE